MTDRTGDDVDHATRLREEVRDRYGRAATAVAEGARNTDLLADVTDDVEPDSTPGSAAASCCGAGPVPVRFGAGLYGTDEADGLPADALEASLGCGNPTAVAELRPGERVLDLGSGGGVDVLLSARRVGPDGFAWGVDMTDEMLQLAEANRAAAGVDNVAFLRGTIEDVPLPDGSVDVVISNCVINLSADKTAVFAEMFRLLAPGGRLGVSDVVAEDHLDAAARAERGSHVGCIAGALSRREYLAGLEAAGFVDPRVEFTHEVADAMHAAIIHATRPVA